MEGLASFLEVTRNVIQVIAAVGFLVSVIWLMRTISKARAEKTSSSNGASEEEKSPSRVLLGPLCSVGASIIGGLITLCCGGLGPQHGASNGPATNSEQRIVETSTVPSTKTVDKSIVPVGIIIQPKLSQVQIRFDKGQWSEKQMELFVDGKVQQGFPVRHNYNPPGDQLQLNLTAGIYDLKLHWHGKEVWADKVKVKPSDQGVTVVQVPPLDDPAATGILVLKFAGPDANARQRVELFIDGKLFFDRLEFSGPDGRGRGTSVGHHGQVSGYGMCEIKLMPSRHTVALMKHGIEVYSGSADVKKPSDGKTVLDINLLVTGTVLIKNSRKIVVNARVCVDGDEPGGFLDKGTPWPIGTTTIEVSVEPGTRTITVYAPPGRQQFAPWIKVESFTVQVEPGKQTVVKMAK